MKEDGAAAAGDTAPRTSIDRALVAVTLWSARHAWVVVGAAIVLIASAALYATRLEIHGNFVALLPTDDETAVRFQSTLDRKGGSGSTLMVVVESPDAEANRRAIDAIEAEVKKLPRGMYRSVAHGPGALRDYFVDHRWLFATVEDLERIECELDRERSRHLPGYLDLGECDLYGESASAKADTEPAKAGGEGSAVERFEREMNARIEQVDQFPTGYFRTDAGDLYALVVRSPTAGMGEFSSDVLFREVKRAVERADPGRFHPGLRFGYAGDIPNAIAERQALVNDVKTVSFVAIGLILTSIIVFFRSALSLVHIGLSVALGCGVAFAVAAGAIGHLNAATSFLGSIIAGNGINYSIVYLARYREMRRGGSVVEAALIDAATTCRRSTWLASLAASGAYAALMLTSFRGFSEFGLIGGVGMVACWGATFLVCPASIAAVERISARWRRAHEREPSSPSEGSPARGGAWITQAAGRFGPWVLVAAGVLAVVAAVPLPSYLRDPWEYDFSKLKSESSSHRGAGHFSRKATTIFQTRGSPMLVLADDMSGALDLKKQVEREDQRVTGGKFVSDVKTIFDYLGGPPEVVQRKMELLGWVREHLDALLPHLSGHEREIAEKWRPPDDFRAPRPEDLPEELVDRFGERDGRLGTAVYVSLSPGVSQSRGENLLAITDIFEGVKLPSGKIAPNASRATVFAAMIRSMERDGPKATFVAFLVVVGVAVLVARSFLSVASVIGSLLLGVLYTVGGAAWFDVRLNFLNFVALPLTFGIGVEYAINLYERIRVSGDVGRGVASVGGAVALCSATTIIGYGALLFADNRALQSFGRYAIFGELSCIVTALLVLPAMLQRRFARSASVSPAGAPG